MLRSTGAAFFAGGAGCALDAAFVEPHRLEVTTPQVRLANLPPAWDGVRIAHWTDEHWLWKPPREFYQRAVERSNAARPDIVVHTGDFLCSTQCKRADLTDLLRGIHAPLGHFAVPGNHDHDYGLGGIVRLVRAADVQWLTNRGVSLRRDGQELWIGGVDDLWHGRQDLAAAVGDAGEDAARLLLCHNPDFAEEIRSASPRVDLMLCGHSHGGQVCLPLLRMPSSIRYKQYRAGLVQGPRCQVYTSRGLGMGGPYGLRFRCPPELAILTLRRG